MNTGALKVLENQQLEIQQSLMTATSMRETIRWELERYQKKIDRCQEQLRTNKIAQQALQDQPETL